MLETVRKHISNSQTQIQSGALPLAAPGACTQLEAASQLPSGALPSAAPGACAQQDMGPLPSAAPGACAQPEAASQLPSGALPLAAPDACAHLEKATSILEKALYIRPISNNLLETARHIQKLICSGDNKEVLLNYVASNDPIKIRAFLAEWAPNTVLFFFLQRIC